MFLKPESITRLNASIINGSDAKISRKAAVMEIGKPSERIVTRGAAYEIRHEVRDVKNKVP
ncbi:hypothetical protein, partial [Treponema sp. R8-4-B8]